MFCSREGHDNTLAYIQRQLTFTILSAEAVRTNTFVNVRSLVETRTTIKTRVRVTNWHHRWKRNVNKLMQGLLEEHLANFSKDLLQPLAYGSVIYTRWTTSTLRSNTFVFYSLVFFCCKYNDNKLYNSTPNHSWNIKIYVHVYSHVDMLRETFFAVGCRLPFSSYVSAYFIFLMPYIGDCENQTEIISRKKSLHSSCITFNFTYFRSWFLKIPLNTNTCTSCDCRNMFPHFCTDCFDICFQLKEWIWNGNTVLF